MTDPKALIENKIASIELNGDFLNQKGQVYYHSGGLTKREYFAALAMQGCLANADAISRIWIKAGKITQDLEEMGRLSENAVAANAVGVADALIEALNETK
jgi:hypothetical protein